MHVPKEKRLKLDYKAIFLGYGGEEFGYIIRDPYQGKFIRSTDLIFYEDQTTSNSNEEAQPNNASKKLIP